MEFLVRDALPSSQNLDPVSDQNMLFCTPIFRRGLNNVRNVDNAINWINLYLVDNAVGLPDILHIHWIVIYPVDTAI